MGLPFLGVASLATKHAQRISWLSVGSGDPNAKDYTRGVVFGGGIEQARFRAEFNPKWVQRRPLFTLGALAAPHSLPVLLQRWRTLEQSRNPFLELYRSVLFQPDLPARAQFLYLVQALEALHTIEHRPAERGAQTKYKARRRALLDQLGVLELNPSDLRFIRNTWSKRRPISLESRLHGLLRALPTSVETRLRGLPGLAPIADQLCSDGIAKTLPAQLSKLRNQLSHGDRTYDEDELRPWVEVVNVVAQANLLRLLGFDQTFIEHALEPEL